VFSGPFEINEDVGVEPNGRELLRGAAMVAEFTGNKISAFRNYFDDATLMEQMLATSRRSCSAGGGSRTASSSRTRRIRPTWRCSRNTLLLPRSRQPASA
jgi:hypothetical protein